MNIQDLKSNTTWQEASNTINNNNNKISLAIATLENATLKNKGYFTTVEKLNEAVPNPTIGSKAYVGTSEPYAIYIVENGVWVDSGYTGGDEIVAKITTDRIEDGAVTSEKIATTAFDDTLSVSRKIAPADVVGEKINELDKKVDALAIGAFYGYFPDSISLPTDISTPGYAYVGLDNPYKIWNFNGESWSDSGTSIDMNDADEEDITRNTDGKLQFKDRVYGDGMGYVILRKDKTFAEQVTKENTIYEIRYKFDLNGKSIVIPVDCVLEFKGGSLKNGTIIGNNTKIIAGITCIFEGISTKGNFNIECTYAEWFGAKTIYKRTTGDADATSTTALNPPTELDDLESSSEAINSALQLASISGCICRLLGRIYRIDNTIEIPEKTTLETVNETIIFPYLYGLGNNVTTQDEDNSGGTSNSAAFSTIELDSPVRVLLPNQYISTNAMKKAISIGSVYSGIRGGGTLSLVKSKYTIGLYVYGTGYRYMDMTFMSPFINMVVVGGKNVYSVPDYDSAIGQGEPTENGTKVGETYWDKLNEYIYTWNNSKWNKGLSTNNEYNTSLRVEVTTGWNSGRIIYSNITIRDSFGFRGIEICTRSGGWFNKGKWDGSISYKSGSFLSIFTNYDVTFHDFTNIQMQYQNSLISHETRMVYAIRCSRCKFPFPWDVSWTKGLRLKLMWELGKYTSYNEITIDGYSYYNDRGTKNFLSEKIIDLCTSDEIIDSNRFYNIWKYRTPYIENKGYSTNTVFQWKSKHDFSENVDTSSADIKLTSPKEMFDGNSATFFEALTSEIRYCTMSFGGRKIIKGTCYIIMDYLIQNGKEGCMAFINNKQYNLKNEIINTQDGSKQVKNRLIVKFDKSQWYSYFDISIKLKNESAQALRIYGLELLADRLNENSIYSGTSDHRPNAAPSGFIYYDETIKSPIINLGTSTEQQWEKFNFILPSTVTLDVADETVVTGQKLKMETIAGTIRIFGTLTFGKTATSTILSIPASASLNASATNLLSQQTIGNITYQITKRTDWTGYVGISVKSSATGTQYFEISYNKF